MTVLLGPCCRLPLGEATDLAQAPAPSLVCPSCSRRFPQIGGIPLLLSEPEAVLAGWARALHRFGLETEHAQSALLSQLVAEELAPRTRARVRHVADALVAQRHAVEDLFAQVGIAPLDSEEPDQKRRSSSILAYLPLIFRDFAWEPEVDEASALRARLEQVAGDHDDWGDVLVLGAGTGRLAWELSDRARGMGRRMGRVVAVDVNPLPYLVTARLLSGQEVELWEIPGHPKKSDRPVQRWQLRPPTWAAEGLTLLFADGLDSPFPPHSFDTVLTPWFIDQVPRDLASLISTVSDLLRPGGRWLNDGPLIYDPAHTQPAHRYCGDEVIDLVRRGGFEIGQASYGPCSYLASPLSTQARREYVLSFAARRKEEPHGDDGLPAWMVDDHAIVPRVVGLRVQSTDPSLFGKLEPLVDGTNTVAAMTACLVAQGVVVDDAAACSVVRGALKILSARAKG